MNDTRVTLQEIECKSRYAVIWVAAIDVLDSCFREY